MSAVTFAGDLRALGYECEVEAHDGLAVLLPTGDPAESLILALRDDALRLAASHGFTHVAMELRGRPGADAAVSGD